jgi:peptide/nickel transport system ATP-binding protein/oligopeptide transport system ATP-binding protein
LQLHATSTGPSNEPVLRIENLHVSFSVEHGLINPVRGVDLVIRRGETTGLVGESGCGKSVTAQSILRLIAEPVGRIYEGRVLFEGSDLAQATEEEMRRIRGNRISMIFQEPMTSLNPVIQIGEQIAETLRLHRSMNRREALEHAVELLNRVRVSDARKRLKQYPHELSGGMRQRVMIAIALSCHPALVIADEPTTALDVTIQAQILDMLEELQRDFGASILLITHDFGVVAEMADRVAVMYAGEIVEEASVAELFEHPLHPYTAGLMASIPSLHEAVPVDRKLPAIPGVVPSLLDIPIGCSFQDRCAFRHDRCTKAAPALAEIRPGHRVRCWLHVE